MNKAKIFFTGLLLLSLTFSFSQEKEKNAKPYNVFAAELGGGASKIQDLTSVGFGNVYLGLRYSPLPSVGARLNLNYNGLSAQQFSSADLMGVVNLARLLPRDQSVAMGNWTVLGSLGGNYTNFNGDIENATILNRKSNFHLKGGIDILHKISNNLAINASLRNTFGVNEERYTVPGTDVTSVIDFNIGLIIGIGKRAKVHADWYIPEEILAETNQNNDSLVQAFNSLNQRIQFMENNFGDLVDVVNEIQENTRGVYIDPITFKHDSDFVETIFDQRIKGIADYLQKNPNLKLSISGYASEPGTNAYNLDLSSRRVNSVYNKLLDSGVSKDQLIKNHFGEKDAIFDKKGHPYDRVVSFEFIKK